VLYPIGEYIHQSLSTTFTDGLQLMQELKETRFTGYVSIHYWGFEALIILDSGQIIQVFYKSEKEESIVSGLRAYEVILEKINEKDGDINVVKTDNEVTLLLAALPYAEEKPQTFVLNDENLVKIQNLLEEKGFSAIVNAKDENRSLEISLYFYEGNLLSIVGKKENSFFIKNLNDLGTLIKLLKSEPLPSTIYYVDMSKSVEVLEDFSLQSTIERWIVYYDDIFKMLREQLVQYSDEDTFKKLLQSSRLELAEEFSFLDPFLEIVQFRNSPIELTEFINIYDFVNGMDSLIMKLLEKYKAMNIKKLNINNVLYEVHKISENYSDLLEQMPNQKRLLSGEITGV
jgi:hypothetical protein